MLNMILFYKKTADEQFFKFVFSWNIYLGIYPIDITSWLFVNKQLCVRSNIPDEDKNPPRIFGQTSYLPIPSSTVCKQNEYKAFYLQTTIFSSLTISW